MADKSQLLWRVMPGVRRIERDRFLFFFLLAALLSQATTIGLVGSEALFLSRLGAQSLPQTFVIASLATVVGSLVYAGVVGRTRNDRLLIVMLIGTALSLLVDAWLLAQGATQVPIILFSTSLLSLAVFQSLHFLTFAADYFDTLSSKRVVPLFTVGASVGGMTGGVIAMAVSRLFSGDALLIAWALALVLPALHVRLARVRLMRWTPVGAAEADESSFEGLRGAVRYVRRSRMFAWLGLSVVGMVVSLTLMQFIYLDIFARRYPSAEELGVFIGVYLAVTNGIEVLVGNGLTPWLIRRFGVAQANLAHPLLTLASFLALAIEPSLAVAVAARVNRELLENALAGPIRALSYQALPRRFRGRMRALLDGVVFYAAMSIAGVALLLIGSGATTSWLALFGGGAALLYACANWIVRREYLISLVEELRRGRLDLRAVAGDLDSREIEGLERVWEETLAQAGDRISLALLELAKPLARRGFTEGVRRQAAHPDPRVRRACLEALAQGGDAGSSATVAAALDDPDVAVRQLASQLIAELPELDEALRQRLRHHLRDEDLSVRARSAACLGDEGHATLREMLADETAEVAVAALAVAPAALLDEVSRLANCRGAAVRAAVLDALTRLGRGDTLSPERLIADLRHDDARVRCAAAAALARRRDDSAVRALADALDDVSRLVRAEAQTALASLGDAGVVAAAAMARGARIWTVDAALCTIARAGGPVAQALLRQAYADRVRDAWSTRLAIELCADVDSLGARFLRAALENANARARFLAFRILELVEDADVVRSVSEALAATARRSRADALEVLSNLADRETSQLLALLLEDAPLAERLPALAGFIQPPEGLAQVLRDAANSPDRWLRLAAGRYGREEAASLKEAEIMERLLALQSVPLFTHLSLEQLEVINRLLQEVQYLSDEVIVREGEPGHELYVLVEGEVTFWKAHDTPVAQRLTSMRPVGYFGEMAILDNAPRSVTAIASEDSRLLTLAGARFKELILQAPEIAFEVFPVLITRIRSAESRLTEQKRGA